jgi:hypothetical protein
MVKEPTHHSVSCTHEGRTYRGNYWVAGKILVVSTMKGGRSRQLGAKPADALAKLLLQELAKEGKA